MIEARTNIFWPPVLGISGFAQSGKTTLLESLLLTLGQRGFKTLVIKNYGNDISLEDRQSDSFRLYHHGADSLLHDSTQGLIHQHHKHNLGMVLQMIPGYYDLILVEGHRAAPIPKLWLQSFFSNRDDVVPDDPYILTTLEATPDREQLALQHLDNWLTKTWHKLPLAAAIVGNWERLNPTALALTIKKCSMFASDVILLGSPPIPECAAIPQMPLIPQIPLWQSAFISAFRWNAHCRWLFVPPDWSIVEDPIFPLDTICLELPSCVNPPPCGWILDFHIPTPHAAEICYGVVYPNVYHLWQQILTEFIGDPTTEWWYKKIEPFELGKRLLSFVQILR